MKNLVLFVLIAACIVATCTSLKCFVGLSIESIHDTRREEECLHDTCMIATGEVFVQGNTEFSTTISVGKCTEKDGCKLGSTEELIQLATTIDQSAVAFGFVAKKNTSRHACCQSDMCNSATVEEILKEQTPTATATTTTTTTTPTTTETTETTVNEDEASENIVDDPEVEVDDPEDTTDDPGNFSELTSVNLIVLVCNLLVANVLCVFWF